MSPEKKIQRIQAFRAEPKFKYSEAEFATLHPSPDSVIHQARHCLNACAEEIVKAVQSGAKEKEIRGRITKYLSRVDKAVLDTEDREYVAYYFHQLGQRAEVDVSFAVNRWLYGLLIAVFSKIFHKG